MDAFLSTAKLIEQAVKRHMTILEIILQFWFKTRVLDTAFPFVRKMYSVLGKIMELYIFSPCMEPYCKVPPSSLSVNKQSENITFGRGR